MEHADDGGLISLIAAYGELREERESEERTRSLGGLVADLLGLSGIDAAYRNQGSPAVAFRHDGRYFLVGLVWTDKPMRWFDASERLRSLRGNSDDLTVILLSISGFGSGRPDWLPGSESSRTLVWDRTHFEAILCGVATTEDLLTAGLRRAFFDNAWYVPLVRLLASDGEGTCARMVTQDLRPAPWPVLEQPYDGIPAELILVGEDGWDLPSGIATLDDEHLVVVTSGGLVALDVSRGSTSWIARLPGVVNEPLVLADGSVLAARNGGVIRAIDGNIEAIAGGFPQNSHVLSGPGGEAWVLSGHGHAYGRGDGGLALTRIGEDVGNQHRYDIYFDAEVHTAGWLGQRTFFLSASGNSAVIDLNRSSHVRRSDWIESPQGYRTYLVVTDDDCVVTAAGGPTGLGVTLFKTDVTARTSQLISSLNVNYVHGFCTAQDGMGYMLADVYAGRRDSRDPWPLLIRFPELRRASTTPQYEDSVLEVRTAQAKKKALGSATTTVKIAAKDSYDAVRLAARGERKDYSLGRTPIDRGGQAEVFRAVHKPSGQPVAFKRLLSNNDDAIARMQREIDVARALGDIPHVMPVLDHSNRFEWFVMPLAEATAAGSLPELSRSQPLRNLVTAMCDALRPAHALGWVHRDLKPANLLRVAGSWTVGDWGLGRRPRGYTTNPDRTQVGVALGTEGFAAPELSVDAHQVGPQADVYSIGQIIGWALRQEIPRANIPLLPVSGPWRRVAREATRTEPESRPATVDDLLKLIRIELNQDEIDTHDPIQQLLTKANDGDDPAAARLFTITGGRPGDIDLYVEVLAKLSPKAIRAVIENDASLVAEFVDEIRSRFRDDGLSFEDASSVISLLHSIEAAAARAGELDLLQDAVEAMLAWDAHWDQWAPQLRIKAWMASLKGNAASIVAGALRKYPYASRHFEELHEDRQADQRIRRAVRPN